MDYVKRVDWDVFPYGPNVDDECFSDTLRDTVSDEKCTLKNFWKEQYRQNYFRKLQHYTLHPEKRTRYVF